MNKKLEHNIRATREDKNYCANDVKYLRKEITRRAGKQKLNALYGRMVSRIIERKRINEKNPD